MRLKAAFTLAVLTCLTQHPYAQQKPRFSYAYVTVTYQCSKTNGNIAVFSQVFGVCYQDTNHSAVARGQRMTYDQVAKASCGGEVSSPSQRTDYPYTGVTARTTSEQKRAEDVRDSVKSGYKVESAFLQTPYSTKCAD